MPTDAPRQRLTAWLVAVTCASTLALLVAGVAGGLPSHWLAIGLFLVLIAVPGTANLELPSRLVLSPGTLIVCAAIGALPPHGRLVAAWLLGAADGIDLKRLRAGRPGLFAFNVAQLGAVGLATAGVWQLTGGRGLLSLVAAALTFVVVNDALVVPGVVLQSGKAPLPLLLDLRTIAVEPPIAVLGLWAGERWGHHGLVVAGFLVAPAIATRLVLTVLARSRHAYERLEAVHSFAHRLEASPADAEPLGWMLGQLLGHFGAQAASAVVDDDGTTLRSDLVAGSDAVTAPAPAPAWAALDAALAARTDPSSSTGAALRADGFGAGMVTALQVDGRRLGAVAVSGTANQRELTDADLRLFETFAGQAAAWLERRRLLDRLRHDSTHDHLTGLPNRRHFLDLVGTAGGWRAVLVAGLDRFKDVNDTLGHDQGDVLLCAVGARLRSTFPGAVVARLGGDEFGVLLVEHRHGAAASAAAALLTSLEQPFAVGELALEITAAVGVSAADGAAGALTLLQQADIAMARAKAAHSGWELHQPDTDTHSPWRLSLAGDLRRGIDNDELEVHYQPKAHLATGAVCGVEALVRWRHPRYGLLSPDQFVPIAEQAGLIRPLTMSVLGQSCRQLVALERVSPHLSVAVNLSVRSLLDVNLPDQIAEVLAEHGLAPDRLTLEITEGSLMADPSRAIGVVSRLHEAGIDISIDDFGTGFSSLGYLKRLPAAEVKIDRSFVSAMHRDHRDAAIVRSTVELAHNLGLRAVAEGVEDPGTWRALDAIGCDQAQGYFLSAPLPPSALHAWLLRLGSSHRFGSD